MKTLIKITTIIFLSFLVSSCIFEGVRGNGNVISKNRKISNDFVKIKASRGLDVYITKSDNLSLVVEADENLQDLIQTEVIKGTLVLTTKRMIGKATSKKIHLSVNNLNDIQVSSGAEIYSENTFESKVLKVEASSGAIADLNLKVINLVCKSSSGANVEFNGIADDFKVNSTSGSNINSFALKVMNCEARATSGSNIKINVTSSLNAKASSGAHIEYIGNPQTVQQDRSSGGSIRNKNSG